MESGIKKKIPPEKTDVLPEEFASDDMALRYLAKILVQAYFDNKNDDRNKTN